MTLCMQLVINFAVFAATLGCNFIEPKKIENSTVSLKDYLSKYYDKSFKPRCDEQTVISVDLYIKSFGNIEEANMEFSVFMYLRQTWRDPRLANLVNMTTILSRKEISSLWVPDTFCSNAKVSDLSSPDAEVHSSVALFPNGDIFYSRGAHIVASCDMYLRDFPMDTQNCILKLESYGYTDKNIKLEWKNKSIEIANKEMAQFVVNQVLLSSGLIKYTLGNFTVLQAKFVMNRRVGYYVIQTYIPCVFLVMLSWIVFWMGTDETGNRLTVGITTILTIVFLLGYTNSSLPKVSYVKGMDMYLMVSFLFVFMSLIECIVVDKFYKQDRNRNVKSSKERQKYKESLFKKSMDNSQKTGIRLRKTSSLTTNTNEENGSIRETNASSRTESPTNVKEKIQEMESWVNIENGPKEPSSNTSKYCIQGPCNDISLASKVDRISRVLFPLIFLVYNIAYWFTYLNNIDILPTS